MRSEVSSSPRRGEDEAHSEVVPEGQPGEGDCAQPSLPEATTLVYRVDLVDSPRLYKSGESPVTDLVCSSPLLVPVLLLLLLSSHSLRRRLLLLQGAWAVAAFRFVALAPLLCQARGGRLVPLAEKRLGPMCLEYASG